MTFPQSKQYSVFQLLMVAVITWKLDRLPVVVASKDPGSMCSHVVT